MAELYDLSLAEFLEDMVRDAFACLHSERPLPEISHAHMSMSLLLP